MPAAHPEPQADFQFLKGRRHVALAVSGGSDSMALMRLAARWQGRQSDPPLISVLTVDHGLRPESAEESRRVAEWASEIGMTTQILKWKDVKPKTGVQEKARQARYDLMSAWCRAHGAELLLTAHTLDDQAETVMMRLKRTTSPDSLAGIPVRGEWKGLPVRRPLLALRRKALRTYLRAIGQDWSDDPSNDDPKFERVRIRRQLERSGGSERLAALAADCARTAELLDRCASHWITARLRETDAGICFAPIDSLLPLPKALQQRILSRLIRHYGCGARAERAELARLADWLKAGDKSRATLGGAIIGRRKGEFWVTREAARIAPQSVIVGKNGKLIWDRRFAITAPEGSEVAPAGGALPEWAQGTPIHARRSCPVVVPPEGAAGGVTIAFMRLKSP